MRELSQKHHLDKRTIRNFLDQYKSPAKTHCPRPVRLLVDGTYFGARKEEASWCVVVARDAVSKENLWWQFTETEKTSVYATMRFELEEKGYTIKSVTGDGFGGIKSAFYSIPYQMCLVHMERLVIKGTTRKPLLEAGQVLLALTKTLHTTSGKIWNRRLDQYVDRYRDFLNEKTTNPFTDDRYWTHENLRLAVNRLLRHRKYLFIYEQNKKIPKTTNSLEGHFSHIKDVVTIHRGLSRKQKERVLHSILLASTIAPTQKKLKHIL